jgi:Na+:H+ antiporter, NhaA family
MSEATRRARLVRPGPWAETRRIADILRKETIGGALLLAASALALAWANSSWAGSYETLLGYRVGPASLHLDLTLTEWAADGLLAIFFFVAGLELKREFVAGDLRDPRRAAVLVAAAIGGVLVPAVLYLLVSHGGSGAEKGWAIPTATDIAFALALLAVIGRHLPSALRTFLLTLAVVDDLLAIVIIAVFYTQHLLVTPLVRPWHRWRCSPCSCSPRCAPGGCCCRWPPPPGCWCMPRACTPPSRGCCWASPCR